MRTFVLTACTLLFASAVGSPSRTQGPAPGDSAGGQIAFTANNATSTQAQSVTVAPPRVGPRIAYDQCWADHGNWETVCDIHVLVDGSETLLVSRHVGARWSPDGSRIAFSGFDYPGEVVALNLADGSVANLTNHPAGDGFPAWSRDGRIAFVSNRDGSIELYVMEGDGSNPTRLTHNAGFTGAFRWSPDGGRIAFSSDKDGVRELYVMGADGSNPTRVTYTIGFNGQIAWSFDSGRIAFGCEVESGNSDICSINADGTNFIRLTSDPAGDSGAAFSPVDGRIAFETARFGANAEIAVMATDGTVSRLAADAPGVQPVWSPDGSQLVFVGTTPSWYSGKCCPPEGGACNADDYCMAMYDMNLINADGTGLTVIGSGANPEWFAPLQGRPEAAFTHHCPVSTCAFDGFGSVDYDGTIVSYAWQFGDGTSGSGATPSHTYTHGDHYTATLTVTDDAGATGVVSMPVYANAPPSASSTVACAGPTCTFDGSGTSDPDGTISTYSWWFGDGHSGSGPTATHTFATGTFTVALYVVDNAGGTDIHHQTVSVVNAPPVAVFTHFCYGLSCTFDAVSSSDPDGAIVNYSWSFGDGTTSWGPTVGRGYTAAGTYTVTLTVTGNGYGTGTQSQTVTVANINAPPVAWFTSQCGGLSCSVNASGSWDPDGTIASYAWNFGDGTTGSGATASHTYAGGGAYPVTLTVTDNGGATTAWAQSVTVDSPEVHVGDLDRARTIQQNAWTATVTIKVHNGSHGPVANAVVSGYWTGGSTGSCTTNSGGKCAVSRSGIPKTTSSVSFTVTNVACAAFVYKPADNHDPDGDSNGTTITVSKQ